MSRRTSTRLRGLSKSVSLHGFRGHVRRTRVLQAGRQADRLCSNDKQRVADVQLLAAEDQDTVDRMFEDQGMNIDTGEPVPFSNPDSDSDNESDDEFSGLPEHVSGCMLGAEQILEIAGTSSLISSASRACPRFSIQAQCKTLCHLHNMPYRPHLSQQLTQAFDAYLEIIHRIDQKIQVALNRNAREWRLRNECPACFYRVEDEPALTFDWFVSIDGNNSLKRWDMAVYGTVPRADRRTPRSTYWLSNEEVDKFKYEVKARQCREDTGTAYRHKSIRHPKEFNCVDRWRNAKADVRKKTFDVFEESGIFIATCRHRFILLACDMIKSGELLRAKYPLAMINCLAAAYGPNGACAYDIGCAFARTASTSSIGPRIQALGLRFMLGWHPMYIEGTGNTEGEGCEHVFSAFNELARSTRHATRFHRHQAIEQHIAFWNQDKYEALTRFIRNHYREAMESVRRLSSELGFFKAAFNLTDDDFPRFIAEERLYLKSLKQPSAQDAQKVYYVQVLDDLEEKRIEWNSARDGANAALSGIIPGDFSAMAAAINQARIRVELAYAKLQNTEVLAAHIQGQIGLESPWKVGDEEYNRYKEEAMLGKYREALGELERLVVMRLFELSKLAMSGTGYKLHQQISKGLQRRSEAIRKVITRYNLQAGRLDPPRPPISWKDIAQYSFLGEFDLLQHARDDIRERIWAKPAVREATTKFFKLCRAKEEITRLNVEIRRLRTAIHDEEREVSQAIANFRHSDPLLASEFERLHQPRAAVNAVHIHRLDCLEKRYGLLQSGIGTRVQVPHTNDGGVAVQDTLCQDEAMASGDLRKTPPDSQNEASPPRQPSTFNDIYALYINDPGDHDLLDDEEDTMNLRSMADFLHEIAD
ncbi:hypothetical protein EDD15DRAFT_2201177 [Pisolithus albus]|nr:hypothetical protein EDD15DRAFT_2201177 [Pisolithus albus]